LGSGALNTAFTLIAVLLAAIGKLTEAMGHVELVEIVRLPAFAILLLIVFTWLAWFALLLWRTVYLCWKLAISIRNLHENAR
jgi:hypothetical protein